ncbi:MAG: NfeD family protein [Saccharofermentans sp.]|jgi:membrane protein implicated in regulation of membrane protease activity|nr:NfeD family protein [Saccharofermentans sp.]
MSWWIIWLIVFVVMLVIEAATTALATVWFAAGALVAMIMDLCGAPHNLQIIVMAAVSVVTFLICMIWIRPKLESLRRANVQRTNADRLIGMEGVVIVPVNPVEGKGQVKVEGQVWSAKSEGAIEEGTTVKIRAIEGVKLIVDPV